MFEFIESPAFERFRAYYLDDDEFGELQQFLMRHPEAGKVVLLRVVCENFAGG